MGIKELIPLKKNASIFSPKTFRCSGRRVIGSTRSNYHYNLFVVLFVCLFVLCVMDVGKE